MGLLEDLAFVERTAHKASTLTKLIGTSTADLNPGENLDGETVLDLTPVQQAIITARRNANITAMKAKAASIVIPP